MSDILLAFVKPSSLYYLVQYGEWDSSHSRIKKNTAVMLHIPALWLEILPPDDAHHSLQKMMSVISGAFIDKPRLRRSKRQRLVP
jgi:hypothetical protein